jgi:hypothetical protein
MAIVIDQSRALAGSITPGDTPGFPIVISKPGSYILTSNITVTGPANTTLLIITSDDVTLDLNGYVMIGLGAYAIGIEASDKKNIEIMNGTIKYVSGLGFGSHCRVKNLRVFGARTGINIGPYGMVKNCTIDANDTGLVAGACCVLGNNIVHACEWVLQAGHGSIVHGNTLQLTGFSGNTLTASGSVITHNSVVGGVNMNDQRQVVGVTADKGSIVTNNKVCNTSIGLKLSNDTGYVHNVLTDNNTNVMGGISMGSNICGTSLCP